MQTMRQGMKRLVIICLVSVAVVFAFQKAGLFRRMRNTVASRVPVALPGIPTCPDCNVILVSLDVLRADDLPCYGYARDTAPNLCAFAKRNNYFTRFYSQTSFTLDNHTSMITGLYPTTHHVLAPLKDTLSADIPTLAQVLRSNGYQTLYAGLTHDMNIPLDNGLERGFSEIHDLPSGGPDWRQGYEALLPRLLEGKPTFLFLYSNAPHSPYLVGSGSRRFSKDSFPNIPLTADEYYVNTAPFYRFALSEFRKRLAASDTPESKERNTTIVEQFQKALATYNLDETRKIFQSLYPYEQGDLYISWYWKGVDPKNPAQVGFMQSLYDEGIYSLDEDIAPLLEFVDRPEVKRKTIVIITSDHGEEFQEHGYFDHGWNVYNTETHVPFVVAAPRTQNTVYNALGQSIDVYPTILELVGIKPPTPVEGKSLTPLLVGKANASGDKYLVSELRGDRIQSIQDGRWKLYHYNLEAEKPWSMLFDLVSDPLEQRDVMSAYPEEAARLAQALQSILTASPKYEQVQGEFPSWIDQEKRRRLMERGYF